MRSTLLLLAVSAVAAWSHPVAQARAAAAVAATGAPPALLHSEPKQGETTRSLPTSVRLRFNQPVRLDRLEVFDSNGAPQQVRRSHDASKPAIEQRGGLVRLPPGDYRADWAASTPDGRAINGTLTFTAKARVPDGAR